jgi:AcrR family transcriptional regulator
MPLQARGQATVAAILAATAQLIEEIGHEAVTTNLIASAADVNIATLYQYFSNKQAIMLELFEQQTSFRTEGVGLMVERMISGESWRKALFDAVDRSVQMRLSQTGGAGVRLAVRSSPELHAYDREANAQVATILIRALVQRGGLSPERADTVSRVAMEIANSCLDVWSIDYSQDDMSVVEECKVALEAYFSRYFKD